MHVCAWCDLKLGIRPGTVRGILATNWGMCPGCLSKRLAALMAAPAQAPHKLDLSKLAAARSLDEAG